MDGYFEFLKEKKKVLITPTKSANNRLITNYFLSSKKLIFFKSLLDKIKVKV